MLPGTEPKPFQPSAALLRWTARFCHDRRAVSAVEFALLLPLMMTLYIGGAAISEAIAIYRKVGHTAYVLGDLVAQVSTTQQSDLANVMAASTAVMAPYSTSGAKLLVAAVNYDGTKLTVAWSYAQGTTAWSKNAAMPTSWLPTGSTTATTISVPVTGSTAIMSAGDQIIVSCAQYAYSPPGFGMLLQDASGNRSITMSDVVYLRPRLSTSIPCSDC
eukprot:gene30862-35109_t